MSVVRHYLCVGIQLAVSPQSFLIVRKAICIYVTMIKAVEFNNSLVYCVVISFHIHDPPWFLLFADGTIDRDFLIYVNSRQYYPDSPGMHMSRPLGINARLMWETSRQKSASLMQGTSRQEPFGRRFPALASHSCSKAYLSQAHWGRQIWSIMKAVLNINHTFKVYVHVRPHFLTIGNC